MLFRLVKRREVDANLDVVVLQRIRAEERKHHLNVDTLILQIITSLTFPPTKNWSVMKQEISAFHQSGNKEGKKRQLLHNLIGCKGPTPSAQAHWLSWMLQIVNESLK
ncbi:hypothetical protein ILYODFUR_037468 [Ilyodon furcidens]|uniref:Uncharacterized protein n=1 Tax=Ilyodon furcidens TaxID=33524 RepID=A0ABV0V146_9TELE